MNKLSYNIGEEKIAVKHGKETSNNQQFFPSDKFFLLCKK